MIPDLNIFATVIRALTQDGRSYTVVDTDGQRFMASLQPPTSSRTNDGSPRDAAPHLLRWRSGLLGPSAVPQAGWRLSLTRATSRRTYENMTYELISDPREIRHGAVTAGMQAEVIPVGDLYPYGTTLKEQSGLLVGTVSVALWSERESHAATGTYEEFSGEAPVEHVGAIKVNRKLELGEEVYRITSAVTDLEGPRVKFTARRANA